MIERFFAYSKDHQKPIRLFVLPHRSDGRPAFKNVVVDSWSDQELVFHANSRSPRPVKTQTLPIDRILSADYARGDDGDPLQFDMEDTHA